MDTRPLVVRIMPVLDFGGAESRVVLQSRMSDGRPYRLRVITLHKAGAAASEIRDAGVPVDDLRLNPSIRDLRTTIRLAMHLRKLHPRIIHASVGEAIVHGLLAGRMAGVPVRIGEEVGMPSHSWRLRPFMRALYASATRIVGVTKAVCDYLVTADGAPPAKVVHTYTCADPSFFSQPDVRAPAPTSNAEFRILHVGRLDPVKNQVTLLRAFARAHSRESRLRLRILGEGKEREKLETLRTELGLEDVVELPGFTPDIRTHLLESHLFALPSLSEGCSISMIEAMSTGVPIVASKVGGNMEVLGDHADRWTVHPEDVDGLSGLMLDVAGLPKEAWKALSSSLQKRAHSAFSPDAYMNRLDRLYDEASAASGLSGLQSPQRETGASRP
ncbi:MAG: glycosyltransferase [Myxococcota bacterium]